jgi:hypothetical protein
MLATDVPPSRLASSIETAQRLLPLLEGNRVGVVVFAGEAYPLVPLTTDLDAVAAFLGGIYPGMVAPTGIRSRTGGGRRARAAAAGRGGEGGGAGDRRRKPPGQRGRVPCRRSRIQESAP